jgi:hypothetical protein
MRRISGGVNLVPLWNEIDEPLSSDRERITFDSIQRSTRIQPEATNRPTHFQ